MVAEMIGRARHRIASTPHRPMRGSMLPRDCEVNRLIQGRRFDEHQE
jgi:hypothetical protein